MQSISSRVIASKWLISVFFRDLWLALLLFPSTLAAQDEVYPEVDSNVSFGQVGALAFRDSDFRLAYGTEDLQFGRLWLPPDRQDATRATLIFIHGGCWQNAFFMDHSYALSSALADAGYAVWSLEYRRSGDPGGGWPGSFEDVLQGINYLPRLSPYGVNLDTVILMGHSAGGHLALLAGAQQQRLTIDLAAVFGLAAITDPSSYARGSNSCEAATPEFMGTTPDSDPQLYLQATPATFGLHANSLLFVGSADVIVGREQAELEGAQRLLVEGAGHFDWVHPGTPAFDLLLEQLARVTAAAAQ